MGKLDGKVAAVTGGGRGIGRAVSKALAAQGAAVVVNDLGVTVAGEKERHSPAHGVVEEIRSGGGRASANDLDIATAAGGQGLIDQAIADFGQLDILVNVAGIVRDRTIANMSEAEWDDVIRVHMRGHYCTIHAAAIHMKKRQAGRIINFSSNAALGNPGHANYAAAKAGILGLTYSCANELSRYNVTVNAVMPGAATRMTDLIPDGGRGRGGPGMRSEEAEGTVMDPANVAPLIIFLASDDAAKITGQCFGAYGYRIVHYAPMHPEQILVNSGPWEIDRLFKLMRRTFGGPLKPPRLF